MDIHTTNLRWLMLSLVIVALDQASKQWITTQLSLGQSQPIMAYVNFTVAHNSGAAFSLLNHVGGWQRWLFIGLAVVITLAATLCLVSLDKKRHWPALGLALVVGGAIGNLIDRVVHGYVVDFLDLFVNSYHWPTFNVADSAICLGIGILIFNFGQKQS